MEKDNLLDEIEKIVDKFDLETNKTNNKIDTYNDWMKYVSNYKLTLESIFEREFINRELEENDYRLRNRISREHNRVYESMISKCNNCGSEYKVNLSYERENLNADVFDGSYIMQEVRYIETFLICSICGNRIYMRCNGDDLKIDKIESIKFGG